MFAVIKLRMINKCHCHFTIIFVMCVSLVEEIKKLKTNKIVIGILIEETGVMWKV